MKRYMLGLRGESNYQSAIARLKAGAPVELVHDAGNPHDARAVKAEVPGGDLIGYAPRDSWVQRALIDEQRDLRARVAEVTGGTSVAPNLGVVLEVFMLDEPGEAVPAFVSPEPVRQGIWDRAGAAALAGRQSDKSKPAADGAGNWLAQRGCGFWVLVGLVVLIIIAESGGDKKVPAASISEPQAVSGGVDVGIAPPRDVTPEELRAAYDENEVAAQQEYGNQPLRVKGTVAGITLDLLDEPVVQLATAQRYQDVQAPMGKEASAAAAGLKKGQKVTLDCESVSEVASTPMLKNCRIAE